MKKENLTEEQMIFQDAVRTFFERESKPHHEQWENDIKASLQRWLAVIVTAAGGAGAMGMM